VLIRETEPTRGNDGMEVKLQQERGRTMSPRGEQDADAVNVADSGGVRHRLQHRGRLCLPLMCPSPPRTPSAKPQRTRRRAAASPSELGGRRAPVPAFPSHQGAPLRLVDCSVCSQPLAPASADRMSVVAAPSRGVGGGVEERREEHGRRGNGRIAEKGVQMERVGGAGAGADAGGVGGCGGAAGAAEEGDGKGVAGERAEAHMKAVQVGAAKGGREGGMGTQVPKECLLPFHQCSLASVGAPTLWDNVWKMSAALEHGFQVLHLLDDRVARYHPPCCVCACGGGGGVKTQMETETLESSQGSQGLQWLLHGLQGLQARSTVGVVLDGCVVDSLVVGGPAYASGLLFPRDRILEVFYLIFFLCNTFLWEK
jgi:hypothetical protein